jgi:hypothetical protein
MRTSKIALTTLPLLPLLLLAACGKEDPGVGGTGGLAATGGTSVGGQSPSTGGSAPAGGAPATGGTAATGGAGGTGGASGTGGAGGGGVPSSGGSGGAPSAGGAPVGGAGSGGAAGAVAGNGGNVGTGAGSGGAAGGGAGGAPVASICPYTPPEDPGTFPQGWTRSEVTVFNDNGGWTWYNDERVVVDAEAGKIVVSSAASNASSQSASPQVHAVIHDLATGQNTKMALGSLSYSDDHNNGGIVVKAPGEYFVAWAHHNVDCNTYWRNYEGGAWGAQVTHAWGQGCPWGTRPDNITYNNPWQLSAEGRLYNFIRSVETSPNFLVSENDGGTWTYGGRLTASEQLGYNAGYYKYWGNGVDRIDFFATESHPRDSNTSIYHGYIKGGKTYDSFDQEIDGNLFDTDAPSIKEFTRVFAAGSMIDGVTVRRLWNFDVARYQDGTVGVLWQGRENECSDKNNCDPKHHVLYSRFAGTEWKSTRLVRGGRTLYRNKSDWWEEDYLGGAALDPDDPHVIYVSTNVDPRDDTTEHSVNEIWKGVTCDDGATFVWAPMTMNSTNENLRPVVPKWDAQNSALLWFRGNYQTAQMYSAEVVGLLEKR